MKANLKLTAVFEEQKEGGYIGYVEEIAGVNTQGESLKEVRTNLVEALLLVLDTHREMVEENLKDKKVIREKINLVA